MSKDKAQGGRIEFWYEFASTYSYLAVEQIEEMAVARGVEIIWRPFLLGPIFARQGWETSPFNLFPEKGRYMWRDMQRLTQKYGLALKMPTQFPRSGVLAARVALAGVRPGWAPAFSKAVFRANFVDDLAIDTPEVIVRILAALDVDVSAIMEEAQSPEIKALLRAETEEAMRLGIFGAPSFVIRPRPGNGPDLLGNELFWGHDRMVDAFEWATKNT